MTGTMQQATNSDELKMALVFAILGRALPEHQKEEKIEYPSVDDAIKYFLEDKDFQGELLGIKDLVSATEADDPELRNYWQSQWRERVC